MPTDTPRTEVDDPPLAILHDVTDDPKEVVSFITATPLHELYEALHPEDTHSEQHYRQWLISFVNA